MTLTDPTTPLRHKSPPYPVFDLLTAITKAQLFYTTQKRNLISAAMVAQTLGYSAKNSEGGRAIAALVSFGLFEEETIKQVRHVKVSALGLNIIRHENDTAHRLPYLQEAALKPPIYADMVAKWPDELPSDLVIIQYLEFDKGYGASGARGLIRTFRSTYDCAQLGSRAPLIEEAKKEAEETPPIPSLKVQTAVKRDPKETAEPIAEEMPADAPPGRQSKTPTVLRETQKFVIPLLAGGRLVVRYPVGLFDSEKDVMDSTFAMIRDSIRAE